MFLRNVFLIILNLSLSSCGDPSTSQNNIAPVAFEKSDECHLCGMAIQKFPGPKGEAYETRDGSMKKFCSTMDLISWYLQPENKPNVSVIYVHDMATVPWSQPKDEHLIKAQEAFFVLGSSLKGSMGTALASFGQKQQAEKFSKQYGGQLLRFNEITLDRLHRIQD